MKKQEEDKEVKQSDKIKQLKMKRQEEDKEVKK